jgi:NCS1 family nucleobase:cation symporter-1
MPDFTRFGRSQREQMVGQVVALPTTMTVFAAMAVLITSASVVIYGSAISDPIELVGRFTQTWIVAIIGSLILLLIYRLIAGRRAA